MSNSALKVSVQACKVVSDTLRTSLGPRGMDKMITDGKQGVTIVSNDGATIMKEMRICHPVAKMLVDLSNAQDIAVGDGTTSVVILASALLEAAMKLIDKGVRPNHVAKAFVDASAQAESVLMKMSSPIDISDRNAVILAAKTSLNSKIISGDSSVIAPIAVDVCSTVCQNGIVDLNDVKVVTKVGGAIEDIELVKGLVFTNTHALRGAGGPITKSKAKIGLVQFHLGPPKTDMEQNLIVKNYESMDKIIREERVITAKQVKDIAATGCNVLLVQKSIIRTAVSELACDYLAKMKILLVRDIEREDVEFISRTTGAIPVASLDNFTADKLGFAENVVDEPVESGGRITRITGVPKSNSVTVLCRASNHLLLEETERSLHDALCVVRTLYEKPYLVPGGGAPEMELSINLRKYALTKKGVDQLCIDEMANALEILPYTLSENSGLNPIDMVTQLKASHLKGNAKMGINIKRGIIKDLNEMNIVQPLLVNTTAIKLATETVASILRVDDILICR